MTEQEHKVIRKLIMVGLELREMGMRTWEKKVHGVVWEILGEVAVSDTRPEKHDPTASSSHERRP